MIIIERVEKPYYDFVLPEPTVQVVVGDDSGFCFNVFDSVDETIPVTVEAVKFYLTECSTGITINNRDGSTNTSGITIEANHVKIVTDGNDNALVKSPPVETENHYAKIEVFHNGGRVKTFKIKYQIITV